MENGNEPVKNTENQSPEENLKLQLKMHKYNQLSLKKHNINVILHYG